MSKSRVRRSREHRGAEGTEDSFLALAQIGDASLIAVQNVSDIRGG
jgi:hypothetical protein